MQNTTNKKIPPRYENVKWEDLSEKYQKMISESIRSGKGLYFFGKSGTGKTHIAYCIMKRCIEKSIRVKLMKSTEMLDTIRFFYGQKNVEYRDNELQRLLDFTGLLIIDDIGVEKPTEWVAETFYKIIDKRYEEKLITIFTSNLSLDDLAEAIGDRVPSRIAEMCEIVKLNGEDRRLS